MALADAKAFLWSKQAGEKCSKKSSYTFKAFPKPAIFSQNVQHFHAWEAWKRHQRAFTHIYLQKMKYYLCKQPFRYTELSIKVDLLDASCGGAFNDIVGQLVTIVTRQFSQ